MKLLCKYYTNSARLVEGIATLSSEPSFRFFCLEGSVVKNRGQFKAVTPRVTVYVFCVSRTTKKGLMALLTNDPKYKESNGSYVEISYQDSPSINYTLCELLLDKFSNTQNVFEIDFAGNGVLATVTAKVQDSGVPCLMCTLKGGDGEAVLPGEAVIRAALQDCTDIKRFFFTSVTDDVDKTIIVKKSRGEILREVSHYLNKTLVLVSMLEDNRLLEQYISSSSVLEVYTKQDGSRFYKKISPIVLKNSNPFCLYMTVASVDDIMKEQGRSLRKNS